MEAVLITTGRRKQSLKGPGSRLSSVLGIREAALSAELQTNFKGEFPANKLKPRPMYGTRAVEENRQDINLLPEEYRMHGKKKDQGQSGSCDMAGTTAAISYASLVLY